MVYIVMVVYDVIWWFNMVYGGICWCIMVYDDIYRYDGLGGIIMHDGAWWYIMVWWWYDGKIDGVVLSLDDSIELDVMQDNVLWVDDVAVLGLSVELVMG